MHSAEFIKDMQAKLLAEKQRLEQELAGLVPHTDLGDDYDENATEVQIDEVNQDLIARIKADLEKIDAALARIDAGTYGVDASGQDISEERLRAIPWAETNV